jgi:hypothetical protein
VDGPLRSRILAEQVSNFEGGLGLGDWRGWSPEAYSDGEIPALFCFCGFLSPTVGHLY